MFNNTVDKRKVVIIDDDEDVRWSLKRTLTEGNYDVFPFANGEGALPELSKISPEVVILDKHIQGHQNGIEVLKKMRKSHEDIPVIFLTGYGDIKTSVEAMKLGAYDYLLKPCDEDQLFITIEKAIEHSHLITEVKALKLIIQNRHLKAINNISQSLFAVKDTTELIQIAPELICDELEMASCLFCLVNEDDKKLIPVSHHGLPEPEVNRIPMFIDKNPYKFIINHRKPYVVIEDSGPKNGSPQNEILEHLVMLRHLMGTEVLYFLPVFGIQDTGTLVDQASDRVSSTGIVIVGTSDRNLVTETKSVIKDLATIMSLSLGNVEAYEYLTESYKKYQNQAIRDGMTGLYNHAFFKQQLEKEVSRSERHNSPVSLMMIDADNFKHYNDTNGHPAGDKVLKKIAEILKENTRISDTVCRYGGEEFSVLLPDTDKEHAVRFAEKIRKAVETGYFHNQESQPSGNLTISIGIAESPADCTNHLKLMTTADENLYRAKNTGKNRVVAQKETIG